MEYHAALFPYPAQEVLAFRLITTTLPANDTSPDVARKWAEYEPLPASVKAKAVERQNTLAWIDAATAAGITKTAAIIDAAQKLGVSTRTISNWCADVVGIDHANRLPFLVPQRKGGGKEAEIDGEAWRILKTDYLRPEKPSFMSCYNRLAEGYAKANGITLPVAKTLQRRMEREVNPLVKKAKREGREAVRRSVPPMKRTVMDLHAMEVVNVDGHTFDVFVQWEDGRIGRPVAVGIQDVFSRKTLAHRIGETENTVLTRLAFADLFRDYGIPKEAVMDNGRAFASKALTGGALTRFRFKIKDTDPTGVLTALGIRIHWTLPYRGSSKPIERAWKDVCEEIAKHPAMAGAYTGNKPDAKPENYRERAIPIAEFRAHVARELARLNARTGRRTEAAQGRCLDDTFATSYATAPIGKARPEQLRLALLEAVDLRCHKESGAVTLMGNVYWSPEMVNLAGKVVTARFDPENLHTDLHVYRKTGEYYGVAAIREAIGFLDKAGAEKRSKEEANLRRKVREGIEAADLMQVSEMASLLAESNAPEPAPLPEPSVVRPVRHRGQTAAALKRIPQADTAPAVPTFIDDFAAGVARLRVVE